MNFFEKLKSRWGVSSNWQVLIIFIVFGITGSSSLKVASPILNFMGIHGNSMSPYLYWPLRVVVIFPVYQVLLLLFGTLLGQFRFFWNFEKKMVERMIGRKR